MTTLPVLQHLIIVPVLLPLLAGALMIIIDEKRHGLKSAIGLLSTLTLGAVAITLLLLVDKEHWEQGIGVYLASNWQAPFGIALMVDRLAAMMLVLTATIALAAQVFSVKSWGRIGVHFHSLFQFLLMGLNGAFLTNDLFNLFVFFEVMLAASYGLVLHAYNPRRVQAGMQYIAINLVASFLFLIGVALIYASTGTLNLADLSDRVANLGAEDAYLLCIGASVLALAFLIKSAVWPLGFWLPRTYSMASPPVGAMLVLMTKVGVYAMLRTWFAVFGDEAGALTGFGFQALTVAGMATMAFGAIGMLASQEGGRMAGYGAIVSSGTLLALVGQFHGEVLAAGLYYLIGSTLAMSAFMLLVELTDRIKPPGISVLAVTMEAFAIEDNPEDPVGVGIPGTIAFLALSFVGCALVISGMPPLAGFVAKFSVIHAILGAASATGEGVPMMAWLLIALLIAAGLAAIISLMRFGVRTFWATTIGVPPKLRFSEAIPVGTLLVLCVALTAGAGSVMAYLGRTAEGLMHNGQYAERVLGEPPVVRAPGKERAE